MNITDTVLNTPTGVVATVGANAAYFSGIDFPLWINVGTVIYLGMLIIHKGWQLYKEWKGKNAPSE